MRRFLCNPRAATSDAVIFLDSLPAVGFSCQGDEGNVALAGFILFVLAYLDTSSRADAKCF